jgi:hypothetical protein
MLYWNVTGVRFIQEEGRLHMHTWSGQPPSGAVSPTRKLITTIIVAFALAGLITGFALGGLTASRSNASTGPTGPQKTQTPVAQNTVTATPTRTPTPVVLLGFPQFKPYPQPTESAASNTTYTVGMQAVDKQNHPVSSANVTCKLWLIQQLAPNQKLSIDPVTLKAITNLQTPIQGTITGTPQPVPEINGLTFDPTTPQTALCSPNGQVTWKYAIAPTVPPGLYDLVILADWQGKHYNWYWTNITIQ